MFAMALQSTGNIDDYWMEEDDGVIAAPYFNKKLGMSKNLF